MESKLKTECMDQSGELYQNLLLREFGYPHLPNPVFVPEPKTKQAIIGLLENKSDAWNDAGTKPDHPCLCETDFPIGKAEKIYQFWNGKYWGLTCRNIHWAQFWDCRASVGQSPTWRGIKK